MALVLLFGASLDAQAVAAMLAVRHGGATLKQTDIDAVGELFARLTDAARELRGQDAAPNLPATTDDRSSYEPVIVTYSPDREMPLRLRPLAHRPALTSLPPPRA